MDHDPDAVIHVLVREQLRQKLATMVAKWPGAERIVALIGDLTVDNLGTERVSSVAVAGDHRGEYSESTN